MTVRTLDQGKVLFQAGRPQFPADQPHTARLATLSWAGSARSSTRSSATVDRRLAPFSDLDLSEAKKTHFKSLHDCFTRELKAGARPIDPDPASVSPCDAIVGACGTSPGPSCSRPRLPLHAGGSSRRSRACRRSPRRPLRHAAADLEHVSPFHAPYDCDVEQVTYISGDTWNVNPIALKRVEQLFCKNERARAADPARAPATSSPWSRSRRSWWRAFGCTFSTCRFTSAIAGRM